MTSPRAARARSRTTTNGGGAATRQNRPPARTRAESRGAQDRWTARARPGFLYVIYALLLWAIPVGLIGAIRPEMARGMAAAMHAYLAGLPEPLYALFGAGYLGYTAARQWGKMRGVDR